jgi:hypothetical protein
VVPLTYLRQAPAPSHMPSRAQVFCASGPQVGWPPAGALPASTGEQVPPRPARLQAWQASLQALSQHTPSAQ